MSGTFKREEKAPGFTHSHLELSLNNTQPFELSYKIDYVQVPGWTLGGEDMAQISIVPH